MKRFIPFFILALALGGCVWAQDTMKDAAEALRQLFARASEEDPKALYELARLYDTGYDTIPADKSKSNSLYLKAAEKGYAPARNILGFRYYQGEGLSKNIDSALYWIRLAAEDGDLTAASNLGYLLSQSEDVPHNYAEAALWLGKAADASIPSALSQLGDLKRLGLGVEPDTLEAVSLYERAIQAGVTDAQLKLLAMMGYKWKELPADSALVLGLRYYAGSAPIAGVDLLEQAASAGNPQALALMADAYSRGIGVGYDHKKSMEYFYKAAQAGNPSAQFIIAEYLEFFPDAIPEESPRYWYDKAADAGILDSEKAYQSLFSFP